MIFAIILAVSFPLSAFASEEGDLQRRVADAYEHVNILARDMTESELRGEARARVRELSGLGGWMDYYHGRPDDGGPAVEFVFVEFQAANGSGVVEVYYERGDLLVAARFSQTEKLTWEFKP